LANPRNANVDGNYRDVEEAAQAIGVAAFRVEISRKEDFPSAASQLAERKPGALIMLNDPGLNGMGKDVAAMVNQLAIPAIYPNDAVVEAGGLMSYGSSLSDAHRQAGAQIARILKGARPETLPVLQVTKLDLLINFKTARATGITV